MDATKRPVTDGSADGACSSNTANLPEMVPLETRYQVAQTEHAKSTTSHDESISSDPTLWTDEKPFTCPMCRRRYTQQQHLVFHKRTHDGNQHASCSECEKIFGGDMCAPKTPETK